MLWFKTTAGSRRVLIAGTSTATTIIVMLTLANWRDAPEIAIGLLVFAVAIMSYADGRERTREEERAVAVAVASVEVERLSEALRKCGCRWNGDDCQTMAARDGDDPDGWPRSKWCIVCRTLNQPGGGR